MPESSKKKANSAHVGVEKVVVDYLKAIGVRVSRGFCQKLILSHPDYPSVLSVADSLEKLGLDCKLARVPKHSLDRINFPYLTVGRSGNDPWNLIQSKTDLSGSVDGENTTEMLVFQIDGAAQIKNSEHEQQYLEDKKVNLWFSIFAVSALFLLTFGLFYFQIWQAGLLITSLVGAMIGYFLVAKEFGITYGLIETFCNRGKKSSCQKELNAQGSKVFKAMNLADVVFVYFLFLIALLLGSPAAIASHDHLNLFFMLSLLAIPVVIYSIYYQYFVLHVWCNLCLLTNAVLVSQAIIMSYAWYGNGSFTIDPILLIRPVALCTLLASLYLLVKHYAQQVNRGWIPEVKLSRLMYSPVTFSNLLYSQKRMAIRQFKHEIRLGNPTSPVKILMVSNLNCNPCKKALGPLFELLSVYPDRVSVSIRFVHPKPGHSGSSELLYVLNHWLQDLKGKPDELTKLQDMLTAWQHSSDSNFQARNGNGISPEAIELEKEHYQWTESLNLEKTPAFYVNGYELPSIYNVEDIVHLVPFLAELATVPAGITYEAKA
jgi:hypothetical protein